MAGGPHPGVTINCVKIPGSVDYPVSEAEIICKLAVKISQKLSPNHKSPEIFCSAMLLTDSHKKIQCCQTLF